MTRAFGRIIVTLVGFVLIAAVAQAKSYKAVYLKDGGVIECRKVWLDNGKINVLVNRDTFIVLTREEVNLKKTFPKKPAKAVKKKTTPAPAVASPGSVTSQNPPTTAAKQAPTSTAVKPGSVPAASKTTHPPAADAVPPVKPATPAQGPTSAAKNVQPVPQQSVPQNATTAASKPTPTAATSPPTPPRPGLSLKTTIPPEKPVAPAAIFLGSLLGTATLAPLLIFLLIIIASFWKVFTKAGEAGWKSIIPVYNLFVLVKIAGKPWWWFLLLLVPLINIVIVALLSIALAAKFGHGPLFGLGLALFGFIFFPILAFGRSEYQT